MSTVQGALAALLPDVLARFGKRRLETQALLCAGRRPDHYQARLLPL